MLPEQGHGRRDESGVKKIDDGEVRWGVLGVGDVCEVKSAPALNLVANSRLVAVMRRDAAKAEDYARRHGVERWYDHADALIADPRVNAVYIATPPHVHGELTARAAAAGKPVYVEKPMARTYRECEEMIAACELAGVPLYVAYYRRCLPNFIRIHELIESGAIGDVRYVRIVLNQELDPALVRNTGGDWRVDPDVAGGGYFHDLASHQLDFLDFALGPVRSASGFAANQAGSYAAEDIVTAAFEFESGVVGNGVWCFSTGPVSVADRTTITGSQGEIEFATFGPDAVCVTTAKLGEQVFEFDLPRHIQQPLIQTVVDDLLGRGTCPSTGRTAARTNHVMDVICRSQNT